MSTLYLIATPIGNLEDISKRAIRVMKEASLIAAEDTRHTGKLLTQFGIVTQQTSYFDHNKGAKLDIVLAALEQGDVALVSDAGTPGLNDPGFELVRAALEAGHQVSPIPGPSAPIAALVASGLPTDAFLYLGYLGRKSSERIKTLGGIVSAPYTLVFLEVPHRLIASLKDLRAILGNREICIAREITKIHEEFIRTDLDGAIAHFSEHEPRGEITLVIAGQKDEVSKWSEAKLESELERLVEVGGRPSKLAAELAERSGWPRREIYRRITTEER